MIQLVITLQWINSGMTNSRLIVCQQLQAAMFFHPQMEHISVLIARGVPLEKVAFGSLPLSEEPDMLSVFASCLLCTVAESS